MSGAEYHAWEAATCPRVEIAEHNDNTGARCRHSGGAPWAHLDDHDACMLCNDRAAATALRADVLDWIRAATAKLVEGWCPSSSDDGVYRCDQAPGHAGDHTYRFALVHRAPVVLAELRLTP